MDFSSNEQLAVFVYYKSNEINTQKFLKVLVSCFSKVIQDHSYKDRVADKSFIDTKQFTRFLEIKIIDALRESLSGQFSKMTTYYSDFLEKTVSFKEEYIKNIISVINKGYHINSTITNFLAEMSCQRGRYLEYQVLKSNYVRDLFTNSTSNLVAERKEQYQVESYSLKTKNVLKSIKTYVELNFESELEAKLIKQNEESSKGLIKTINSVLADNGIKNRKVDNILIIYKNFFDINSFQLSYKNSPDDFSISEGIEIVKGCLSKINSIKEVRMQTKTFDTQDFLKNRLLNFVDRSS